MDSSGQKRRLAVGLAAKRWKARAETRWEAQAEKVRLAEWATRDSRKSVHRVFASGGQEAFLEGHVHAFSVLAAPRRRSAPADYESAGRP
jgi:hypothetical protein